MLIVLIAACVAGPEIPAPDKLFGHLGSNAMDKLFMEFKLVELQACSELSTATELLQKSHWDLDGAVHLLMLSSTECCIYCLCLELSGPQPCPAAGAGRRVRGYGHHPSSPKELFQLG